MEKTCLKCGHLQQLAEGEPSAACPQRGAIYAKVEQRLALGANPQPAEPPRAPDNVLLLVALGGNLLLLMAVVTLAMLYVDARNLNRVLLQQQPGTPSQTQATPWPPGRTSNVPTYRAPDRAMSEEALQAEPREPDSPLSSSSEWAVHLPSSGAESMTSNLGKHVRSPEDGRLYRIVSHDFKVLDLKNHTETTLTLPPGFPELSWPTAVAYDSRRHLVSLASLGGEGFLYRYDARAHRWLDYRSLDNLDIAALTYDERSDRYRAQTTQGSLVYLDGDGIPLP
ncbi:hypothetical protein [Pseudomonas sp. PDM13]|uniref:hypothetical protein n=1 Tax=Pseudomonas sp. PDM13 TaxID=2769255 RepID=UPI0021E0E70E|nr:hypothetical protein [Pseudomonas sp. PDM13]MCU9949974.1 hypothetical protein [Pseudomonas sp. PDM13]